MLRIPAILLIACAALPAAAGDDPAMPGWFVLRLRPETALERFRTYLKKPEHRPGHCMFGGAERVVDLVAERTRTVAEIEYRLFCFDPIPTPDRFDARKSPARLREDQIFRTPNFDHGKTVREKFVFEWNGKDWWLVHRLRQKEESRAGTTDGSPRP